MPPKRLAMPQHTLGYTRYSSPVSCVTNGAACPVTIPTPLREFNVEAASLPSGMVMSYYDVTPEKTWPTIST